MKTFSTFLILLTLLFWSMNFSVTKADVGGTPPEIQEIYLVALDWSTFDPITEYVNVETSETFRLAATAIGEVPLYYNWIYAYGQLPGNVIDLVFDLPGEYPVIVKVTDTNGLSDDRLIRIVVGGGFPPPYGCEVDILVDGLSVNEAIFDLDMNALLTAQGAGVEPVSYNWWVNGLPASSDASLNLTVGIGAWYFVYLETIDAQGCRSYDVAKIMGAACIAPAPSVYDADFNFVSSVTITAGDPLTLYSSGISYCPFATLEYFWMIGDEVIGNGVVLDEYVFSEPGVYTIYAVDRDNCGCIGRTPIEVTVLPAAPVQGSICGRIIDVDNGLFAGVTVKLIDTDNNQVGDPIVTGVDGSYAFVDLEIKPYTVMIVTPLGMTATPGESIAGIEPGDPCREVDFLLIPTIVVNDCRGLGYWKHQFDVYLTGKGNAQETATDLELYLDAVYVHFNILGIYMGLGDFDFEDAKNVLTVRGGKLMLERAKQHLFTLLLNFASGRIGNATVISADNRDAADAVTYAAQLILDGDETNDELAKDICEEINHGQMLDAGIVPESNVLYKSNSKYKFIFLKQPYTFTLHQNFPNPGNPSTSIVFDLAQDSPVKLEIFDVSGRMIRTLVNESKPAGTHQATWNGQDDLGNSVASGLYIYRIQAGKFVQSKKMLFVK